jgi:hypothetical protein
MSFCFSCCTARTTRSPAVGTVSRVRNAAPVSQRSHEPGKRASARTNAPTEKQIVKKMPTPA